MIRSPVKTRSGKAVADKEIDKAADKKELGRELSVDSDLSVKPEMDSAVIEAVVSDCLTKDDTFEKLASKLALRIEAIVQNAVATAMKPLLDEVGALRTEVSTLKYKVLELDTVLKHRTDELEQYQRRNNLRVFGVPETQGEDTDNLVVELFRKKLNVDVSVSSLDRSHRVGVKQKPAADGTVRHRPIIVRFTSYRDRRLVFSAKKRLKSTGISIREDLTSPRLELLRKATEKFGRGKVWSQDGRVMWIDNNGVKGMATRISDLEN